MQIKSLEAGGMQRNAVTALVYLETDGDILWSGTKPELAPIFQSLIAFFSSGEDSWDQNWVLLFSVGGGYL